MLFGGGGAKFCCGMPIGGVSLFAFDVGGGAVNKMKQTFSPGQIKHRKHESKIIRNSEFRINILAVAFAAFALFAFALFFRRFFVVGPAPSICDLNSLAIRRDIFTI